MALGLSSPAFRSNPISRRKGSCLRSRHLHFWAFFLLLTLSLIITCAIVSLTNFKRCVAECELVQLVQNLILLQVKFQGHPKILNKDPVNASQDFQWMWAIEHRPWWDLVPET